jgi:hypothetical protein
MKIRTFFQRLFAKSRPVPSADLELIYTDRFGHRYYAYRDPLQMPIRRLIAIESASRFLELNLTKDRLLHLLDQMEQSANRGQIVQLFHYLHEIKTRLSLAGEEECLLQLSACYFLREDEDPHNTDLHTEKIACWKQDPEAYAFFLTACLQPPERSEADSPPDFPTFSQTIQPLLDDLQRLSSSIPSAK